MALLTSDQITDGLTSVPLWRLTGADIERTVSFADFPAAISFVNFIAEAAEKANHHPDIDIRWNKVRLALSSHDAGGLTERDFKLARVIDSLL